MATLKLTEVSKTFGGATALHEVSLDLERGEIHGLVGQNGSGKSTLVKILAGVHAPDKGELSVRDRPVALPLHPVTAQRLGLCFVHQDLGLVPDMDVVENFRLPELARRRGIFLSRRRERRETAEAFHRFGMALDPDALVRDLSLAERAYLAIVRALSQVEEAERSSGGEGAVLVLDEPTVSLPASGKEMLFNAVRRAAERGHAVIFISHYVEDVAALANRITVLRNGEVVASGESERLSVDELIGAITGRSRAYVAGQPLEAAADGHADGHDIVVSDLAGRAVEGVEFLLRPGEILGLTGLLGSGYESVPQLIFGAEKATGGELAIDGRTYHLAKMRPDRAVRAGIAYVPADRARQGAILGLEAWENLSLLALGHGRRAMFTRRRRLLAESDSLMEEYAITPDDPRRTLRELSGGNQQKVLLAKWLRTKPRLLLLNEPTQGVDVGARSYIFGLLRRAAEHGAAVVCASRDQGEVAELCDRALVFGGGAARYAVEGSDLTKEHLTEKSYSAAPLLQDEFRGMERTR